MRLQYRSFLFSLQIASVLYSVYKGPVAYWGFTSCFLVFVPSSSSICSSGMPNGQTWMFSPNLQINVFSKCWTVLWRTGELRDVLARFPFSHSQSLYAEYLILRRLVSGWQRGEKWKKKRSWKQCWTWYFAYVLTTGSSSCSCWLNPIMRTQLAACFSSAAFVPTEKFNLSCEDYRDIQNCFLFASCAEAADW